MSRIPYHQFHDDNIEGKLVANYRFDVIESLKSGEWRRVATVWVVAETSDTAKEIALAHSKDMYPDLDINVILTN